jgi:hypothetical protein
MSVSADEDAAHGDVVLIPEDVAQHSEMISPSIPI